VIAVPVRASAVDRRSPQTRSIGSSRYGLRFFEGALGGLAGSRFVALESETIWPDRKNLSRAFPSCRFMARLIQLGSLGTIIDECHENHEPRVTIE